MSINDRKIENQEQLTEVVDRLSKLLKDPHPGLVTWCQMYGECMEAIARYWNEN